MGQIETPEIHQDRATALHKEAHDSFERCDTDGFVSQWASGISARKEEALRDLALAGGKIEHPALFNLDGTIASTHAGYGQYGAYWVLNDEAAEVFGKRFFSPSQAKDPARRAANNRAKGFTVGTIKVAGYVDTAGNGHGLSGALSVHIVTRPDVKALLAGDFEVITTEAVGVEFD